LLENKKERKADDGKESQEKNIIRNIDSHRHLPRAMANAK
jgi:hypothetical protein